ncbi:NAD(P)H-dependent oxidoreductase [Streptomyces sp. NPDC001581]|uniref:NAD(P)H-dependent oxidoreductase n=1 Tax=Streptomyces sp. NPDC001581 TaxID=3154386 RepID=UPI00332D55AA
MRVGVYLAHPRPGSFHHALFDAVVEELRGRGCQVVAHDLCAEEFRPSLAAEETETVRSASRAHDAQVALHRVVVFRTVTDSTDGERAAWLAEARRQATALLA